MERKTVTIVFTDLVGSTALGEQLDPELLRRILTAYFDRMRAVLERHGGTVEKYIGDAIVGVFGLPQVREDDALRAVRAAHAMRSALEGLNLELLVHGVRLETRTAINTGLVLADPTRPDAPLTADAGNVAARLQQAAQAGEILLGESTLQLVRDVVSVEAVGALELKGKAAPQAAWRLVDVSPTAPAITRRLDSLMVGRDEELGLLQAAFDRSVTGQACLLVTALGAAGVGKSRLADEFISWLNGRATVLRGRCLPYGDGMTYWPIVEIIRQAAASEGDTREDPSGELAALFEGDSEGETLAKRLGSLLGLTDVSVPAREIFWAVRRLLENMARRGPLVIVLDDIQWGESTLLDLMEYVAGWSTGAAILLLCLARPDLMEIRPAWGAGVPAALIRLEALSDTDSERLIDNLLGRAPLADEVRARITDAAGGNPLFVEEILRILVDEGSLRRQNGTWIAAGDLSAISIPPSINALLAARLERLSLGERAVLQRASVVGKVFWWGAVAEISPVAEQPDVGGHLQSLVRKELVRPDPSPFFGEDAFRFSHILIRDAAYAGITKETLAELHDRFAGWLESRVGESLAEFEEILGYHYEQAHRYRTDLGLNGERGAQLSSRAAEHLASAGERALARLDIHAASTLLARAVSLMDARDPRRVDLLVDLSEALTEGGQQERAWEVLGEAATASEALADKRLAAHVTIGEWYVRANEGVSEIEKAEQAGIRAASVFAEHGDVRGEGRAWALIGAARWWAGRAEAAEEALEEARRHARTAGDSRTEADSLLTLSAVLAQGPRPINEAARRAEAVLLEYSGNRTIEAYMSHALAHLLAWEGRFDEARRFARRYRDILRENGQEANWADSSECAADVETLAGNVGEAVRLLTEGQQRYDQLGVGDTTILPVLANALYLEGRWQEAEDPARRTIERGQPLWEMVAKMVLARVLARQGQGQEAERVAREAMQAAGQTAYIVFQGRAAAAMAEVLEILGKDEEAAPFREEAVRLFEQKGATVWIALARSPLVA